MKSGSKRSHSPVIFLMATLGTYSQFAAAQTYYYQMVANPTHFKIASTICRREADSVYESETDRGRRGSIAYAMTARRLANQRYDECMIINGWSRDPADEYVK